MPTSYQMPSYLRGNTPGELGQLAHAGATLQLEKRRLEQQAVQEQTAMAMRAQQAAQQHQEQMSQMETEQAYRQIQTTLRQKEIDQANEALKLRAVQMARRFQAQQAYQDAIQSGADPEKAILQFGPAMGQSASSVAIAQGKANRTAATSPESVVEVDGHKFMKAVNPNTGAAAYHPLAEPKQAKMSPEEKELRMQVRQAQAAFDKSAKEVSKFSTTRKIPAEKKSFLGIDALAADQPASEELVYSQDEKDKAQAEFDAAKKALEEKKSQLDSFLKGGTTTGTSPEGIYKIGKFTVRLKQPEQQSEESE